jgi:hypothetical protein
MRRIAIVLDTEDKDFLDLVSYINSHPEPTVDSIKGMMEIVNRSSKQSYHVLYVMLLFLQEVNTHLKGSWRILIVDDTKPLEGYIPPIENDILQ